MSETRETVDRADSEPAAARRSRGRSATRPKGASGSKRAGKGTGSQTPMMQQFWAAKREQPDALLFFRMGDFYELFGDDAVTASRELGITLTSRSKGDDAMPMAGVPIKAAEGYLMRLVRQGFKVAICEQMQDPRKVKGIVDRQVVRVVTAGTITEEEQLDSRENNFLAALHVAKDRTGLAWVDVSTGRLSTCEIATESAADEIARVQPAELLRSPALIETRPELDAEIERQLGPRITERDPWRFDADAASRAVQKHFKVATLEGFGIEDDSPIVNAAGALLEYLEETQRSACEHIRTIERVDASEFLLLDRATRSCLELVVTQRENRREGTLLDTLDATLTPMGGRLLRQWILAPLRRVEPILHRQQGVAELVDSPFLREDVRELLAGVLDIERLVAKLSTQRANARDLVALCRSLEVVPPMKVKLADVYSKILGELLESLDPLEDVAQRIRTTLVDEPPLTLRDGGLIAAGFHAELDELRRIAGDGKASMAQFQAAEIERTGMQGLKIGFNSVFGYYIEVPRGQISQVPEHYIRKQTIKNSERYVTPELKEFETRVLKAEESSRDLEYDLFLELRGEVTHHIDRILDTAHALAHVDVLGALAQRAAENRYAPPGIDNTERIDIVDGRHPVIERSTAEAFVPNDSQLDRVGRKVTILTGPNMAGKSTYIRQTALITLMAQIGSFVPAKEARIGIVDRIFTRVGASDDIGRGASTFMVEMVEVANILNNASQRSLVVLDEVGRGTSTFDGLALAWAIVEYLHDQIGARALFATHYHQLTELASKLDGVCNMNVAVREWQDEIHFLHKIVDGGTDRSYGIHVARLAGVPAALLERARTILQDLERESAGLAPSHTQPRDTGVGQQLSLFAPAQSQVEAALKDLDPDRMTPIDALLKLKELRGLLG